MGNADNKVPAPYKGGKRKIRLPGEEGRRKKIYMIIIGNNIVGYTEYTIG
ncbi:MAG: hypothetical protein K0R55_4481 [Sporomusa sp.]|jgi:hypothetical protein|nr:hypothetical protein [Sporomusa sp.]